MELLENNEQNCRNKVGNYQNVMHYVNYNHVRSSLDGWHPICSDNWDDSWSNLVCSQLGYSGQKETRAIVQRLVDRHSFWYKTSGVAMTPEPIQVFEDQIKEKECKSGAKIDVECQGFSKCNILLNVTNNSMFRVWEMGLNKYNY